jgi:hypothetical protein
MPIENAAAQVMAAVNVLEHAKAACAHLCHHGLMRRDSDLQRRAELIHAVIRTRRQFKAFRDRGLELQAALERFKTRREAMRA